MKGCFPKLHVWIEPPKAMKRAVVDYLVSLNNLQWLHIDRIEVCERCEKIRATGSSFLRSFETIIIDRKELKGILRETEKAEKQEYLVIANCEKVIIPNH
jgi:hypothetical protein